MIVKNEEAVLDRCLNSTKDLFDEIIIVDTGSTDNTKEIIKKHTNNLFHFDWIEDFSKARNYAFEKSTMDYIMWLDADDIIKESDYIKLKQLKEKMNHKVDIYMMKYNIAFDENDHPTFTYYRERLLKRKNNYKWIDPVHEYIQIYGNIISLDIAISHKKEKIISSDRNLKIYEKMLKKGIEFSPRNHYYYGRELYNHALYEKAIERMNLFLNSRKGWIEDILNACIIISDCYKKQNNMEQALKYLYKTFEYDIPRSKTCSLIGNLYLTEKKYDQAIFWYQTAYKNATGNVKGFYEPDYETFIPYLGLCVCYDRINNRKKAKYYHKKCKTIYSNHPSVLFNDTYFNNKNK